jgi:hypothetical protein
LTAARVAVPDDRTPLLGGGLLYCDPRFHDLNGVPPERRWRYEHHSDGRLVGVLDGVVTDGVLLSGHSAPVGGPDLVMEHPPLQDVIGLVTGALAALRADGIREVRIRARPPVYSAAGPLVEYALLHLGFAVEHADLNMHVDLSGLAPDGDALTLLKQRKRRYVRAALRGAHHLVEVDGGPELTRLHGILAENRLVHGRPLPLARDYLEQARAAFPDRIRLLLLQQDGHATAAAVVYRVLDGIDQVVHWADAGDGGTPSPMDLIAYLVVSDALRRGARLVDLGPASDEKGAPNLGLADFKRAVGAVPGVRTVYRAALD